jgi:hypothetical protein
MEKFSILILLIYFSTISFSQENYVPGFIIKLNGDTTHGFIDYHIRGFWVSDRIYESAVVQVETSPDDMDNLLYNGSFYYRTDSAFLEIPT